MMQLRMRTVCVRARVCACVRVYVCVCVCSVVCMGARVHVRACVRAQVGVWLLFKHRLQPEMLRRSKVCIPRQAVHVQGPVPSESEHLHPGAPAAVPCCCLRCTKTDHQSGVKRRGGAGHRQRVQARGGGGWTALGHPVASILAREAPPSKRQGRGLAASRIWVLLL
jgi:hypothetical protein